ncbi:MAG: hypothetical protein WAL59_27990, partial [Roseiarcus sp.]
SRRSRQNIQIGIDFMKISSLGKLNEIMRHESEARRMSFALKQTFVSIFAPNTTVPCSEILYDNNLDSALRESRHCKRPKKHTNIEANP